MKRVIVYFDGFNFYNGFKRKTEKEPHWKNYYWLDFTRFAQQFLHSGSHELIKVKYFTAPPYNKSKRSRQSALFNANKILHPEVFCNYDGNYQDKQIQCKECDAIFSIPEEKRTDVGIAVHMLLDCFQDATDTLILVSADSDQVPTIQAIKKHFPQKTLKVYFPPERNSTEIFNIAKPIVFLGDNEEKFKNSVMTRIVTSVDGSKSYSRPDSWES